MGVRSWSTWRGLPTAMPLTDLSGAANADMLTGQRAHLALLSFHPLSPFLIHFSHLRFWDDKYLAGGGGGL